MRAGACGHGGGGERAGAVGPGPGRPWRPWRPWRRSGGTAARYEQPQAQDRPREEPGGPARDVTAAVELMGDGPGDESLIGEASGRWGAGGARGEVGGGEAPGGPFDRCCACVTIQAGAGGTDAQDWAQMLEARSLPYLYLLFFKLTPYPPAHVHPVRERRVPASVLERSAGDELASSLAPCRWRATLPSAGFVAKRHAPAGQALSLHAKQARQTSFAAVEVTLIGGQGQARQRGGGREDRSGPRCGAEGRGQNVNKVESAVRVRHLPTAWPSSAPRRGRSR